MSLTHARRPQPAPRLREHATVQRRAVGTRPAAPAPAPADGDALAAMLARAVLQRASTQAGDAIGAAHGIGCGCPGCCAPAPPPATLGGATLQRNCTECGKKGGHQPWCSRRPKPKEKKKAKEASAAALSLGNIQTYRPNWVKDNNITLETVRAYLKSGSATAKKIRGHGRGGTDDGTQDVTELDLAAYKSWHTTEFGHWY